MTTVLGSADDADLEAARPLARIMLTGMSAFSQMADAVAGYPNSSGLAAAVTLQDEPVNRVMLLSWVISASRSQALAENLQAVTEAFTNNIFPVRETAQELAALPEAELAERLERLPPRAQSKIRRLLDTFGDIRPEA